MIDRIPVNVSDIEDLSKIAVHLGVASHELRLDTSLSEIGAHGEVGDRSDHCDSGRDVVKYSMRTRLGV